MNSNILLLFCILVILTMNPLPSVFGNKEECTWGKQIMKNQKLNYVMKFVMKNQDLRLKLSICLFRVFIRNETLWNLRRSCNHENLQNVLGLQLQYFEDIVGIIGIGSNYCPGRLLPHMLLGLHCEML
jgi:hypothetical protein